MKDPVSIIVFASVFLIFAIRLYLRHKGKGTFTPGKSDLKNKSGVHVQEEDYEPYKNR